MHQESRMLLTLHLTHTNKIEKKLHDEEHGWYSEIYEEVKAN